MALRLCQLDAGLVMTRTERLSKELIPFSVAFLLVLFIIVFLSPIVFDRPHLLFERRSLIDLAIVIATLSLCYHFFILQRASGALIIAFDFYFWGHQCLLSGIVSIPICRLLPVLLVFLLIGALVDRLVEYGAFQVR